MLYVHTCHYSAYSATSNVIIYGKVKAYIHKKEMTMKDIKFTIKEIEMRQRSGNSGISTIEKSSIVYFHHALLSLPYQNTS